MTSRELIAWSALHERRARGSWLASPLAIAVVAGAAIAAWVSWRANASPGAASHAWLVGTLVAFLVAFMRVPFHVYWRADAAFLATLPIEGGALFDAAMWRCVRAAAATTLAVMIGAAPLAGVSLELLAQHLAVAVALGAVAAFLMPAVVVWTASLVALDDGHGAVTAIRTATKVVGGAAAAGAQTATPAERSSSTAMLGAVPGFIAAIVIVVVLVGSPIAFAAPTTPSFAILGGLVAASLVALAAIRGRARRAMGAILRDVSALDRQRLARLEIHPPTAIERAIAALLGDGALPYTKDARLMRRRYPLAYGLGFVIFVVLALTGITRPHDPTPWLSVPLFGAAVYAIALAGRLTHAPIELPRLSASLPITAGARRRAKVAWVVGWWCVWVLPPALFASLRQATPGEGLTLLGIASAIMLAAAVLRR